MGMCFLAFGIWMVQSFGRHQVGGHSTGSFCLNGLNKCVYICTLLHACCTHMHIYIYIYIHVTICQNA